MSASYFLKVTSGSEVKEYPLDQPVTSIGRSTDNRIMLDDTQASRRHAEVEWAEGKPRITDLGSSNGTLVNGVRIKANVPYPLKAGDAIGIGSYVLAVRSLPVTGETAAHSAARTPAATGGTRTVTPAKKTSLFRGKSLVFMIAGLIILVAIGVVALLSSNGMHDAIVDESATCLIDMHVRAIVALDSKLDEIDGELNATEEKLVKLNHVVTPCLEWIEIHRADAMQEQKRTSWQYTLDQEELDRLKNDRYQVTKLELKVLNVGLPEQEINQIIEVVDLSVDGSKGRDWMEIKTELETQQDKLETAWDIQIEKSEEAIATMDELIEYWVTCEVKKINSATFTLSGKGMGWSDRFTDGKWTYYRDRNELVPANSYSETLMTVVIPEP